MANFSWSGTWQSNTYYEVNTFVKYENIAYVCTGSFQGSTTPPPNDLGNWNVFVIGYQAITPTPTSTIPLTSTPTATETNTNTPTPTSTSTPTVTQTPTTTPTTTPTNTITNTPSNTSSETPTNTPTVTPTLTPTNSETPTLTPTPTSTVTPSVSDPLDGAYYYISTDSYTVCYGSNPSDIIYGQNGLNVGQILYQDPAGTDPYTISELQTLLSTTATTFYVKAILGGNVFTIGDNGSGDAIAQSQAPCVSSTATPTPTNTQTITPTSSPTNTVTATNTPSNTASETPTVTPTNTETPTNTPSNTASETPTVTPTNTETPTNTPSNTASVTPTNTPSNSGGTTPTVTPTNTETPTNTPSNTASNTPSVTQTPTNTPSNTASNTPSVTQTPTVTNTPSTTLVTTPTTTPSNTPTLTQTPTNTITPTTTTTQTPTNTTTQTPTPTKVVGNSILFTQGNGDYLSVTGSTAWAVGTGDFTVEGWYYQNNNGNTNYLFSLGSTNTFAVAIGSGGNKLAGYMGGTRITNQNISTATNVWYHWAVTRSAGTYNAYFNGTRTDTLANSTNVTDSVSTFFVGYDGVNSSSLWPGNMTNFRFVKGTAVYTGATYTVPTSPLTPISGTQLLLAAKSLATFTDDTSGTNKVVVNNGTPPCTFSLLTPF